LLTILPPDHNLTVKKIIQEQTLFPFYQPFLSPERVQKVTTKMGQNTPHNRQQPMSLSNWQVPKPKRLRFCYDCLLADRKQYGQAYWHRLHQVPGVKICPQHGAILQESQVAIYFRPPTQRYISAEQALDQARPVPNSFPPAIQQVLLQIARDAAWLLQHDNDHITLASLLPRFRQILVEQGLAPYKGRPYISRFLNLFQAHYSPELLSVLDCPLDHDNFHAWPVCTVYKETTKSKHPLQHLLVIRVLGYSVERFFALPTEGAYFGQAPWPCLNPVCDNYRQTVIETYHLDYQQGGARPRATFACETCGFTYRRLGPDTSPEDRYRIDRVVTRGSLWEARLAQLRADPTVSTAEISRQLNTDRSTIAAYIIVPPENQPDPQAQRERYRAIWLEALARFPEATVSEFSHLPEFSPAYHWLLQHDREWYNTHTQDGRKTYAQLSGNWARRRLIHSDRNRHTRDVQLAEEVRLAAQHLLEQPGKPQKLTQAAICYHLNLGSFRCQKFPIAVRTLKTLTEPYELFIVRRLLWAINDYHQQGYQPTQRELLKHTGVIHFFSDPRYKALGQQMLDRLDASNLENGPSLIYTLLPSMQQDWPGLDVRLAEAVAQSARRLKHNSGYPTRITASTIGLDLDQLELLLRHLQMLPKTDQTLAEVVETEAAFAHRVLVWIMTHVPDARKSENRTDFVRLTGLQPYDHLPTVAKIITETFDQLQTQNTRCKHQVNWMERDDTLARAVRQAAITLKERSDVWITVKSISQLLDEAQLLDVSIYPLLLRQRNQLPQTD